MVYVPADGQGRDQPRHRPVLARTHHRLGAIGHRRPRRPGARAGRLGRAGQAGARAAGGHHDLRAARAGLLDQRRDGAGGAPRHVPGVHRRRQRRDAAPRRAGRCRDDAPAPAAGVRLRDRSPSGAPTRPTPACDLGSLRARLRAAAGLRRGGHGQGRLQLGLRPVALHHAGGLVRHQTRRVRSAPVSSGRWCRASTAPGSVW